jgi:hypothetical protein
MKHYIKLAASVAVFFGALWFPFWAIGVHAPDRDHWALVPYVWTVLITAAAVAFAAVVTGVQALMALGQQQ